MTTYFQSKFDKTGLKQNHVAEGLDVHYNTISKWLKLKDVDTIMKFIRLMNIADVHTCDLLNIYYNTDKYSCKHCKKDK